MSDPADADPGSPPGVPRWLTVSALVVVIALVGFFVGSSLLGVQHGPGPSGPFGH